MDIKKGLKDGIPIAAGYFAVSFSFGILAKKEGLSTFIATLISLTNVTSAGQFAGLQIIVASGTILEIILTQFIINLRYSLMSLSLSQKLSENTTTWQRMIMAFANTDEIFAVAISKPCEVNFQYMIGLEFLPIVGWTLGTFVGAEAVGLLPQSVCNALGLALYGMFVAIVAPVAKEKKSVSLVVLIAAILSCIIYYVDFFDFIPPGISVIICTVVAASVGAFMNGVRPRS